MVHLIETKSGKSKEQPNHNKLLIPVQRVSSCTMRDAGQAQWHIARIPRPHEFSGQTHPRTPASALGETPLRGRLIAVQYGEDFVFPKVTDAIWSRRPSINLTGIPMRNLFAIVAVGCALLTTPGDVIAQGVVTRVAPQQFANALTQAGIKAEVARSSDNSAYVRFAAGPYKGRAVFYGCNNQGCSSYTLAVSFQSDSKLTVERANAWNEKYRYMKAYVEADGTFDMEYDVDIGGGVAMASIAKSARLFNSLIDDFNKFIP
jgi:hypothetical protein